ncbi:arylsulfotransferase family protein [Nocardioides dilutus]
MPRVCTLSVLSRASLPILAALITLCALLTPASPARAADEPVHGLAVIGTDVGMFPAYDPAVARYAVTTGEATAGTLTVTATSSDPDRRIHFNGIPDPDGVRTFIGLDEGDEIAVFIRDSGGLARYALIYLPAGFPALERVSPDESLGEVAPGHVLLTLGLFLSPSDFYETAVDVNGVPAFARAMVRAMDLQRQPNGNFSVFRPTTAPGRTGSDLIELDAGHQPVRTWRTVGLVNTDPHDAILLPDGSAWLMAYEPNANTDLVDAVIQHIAPDGDVLFSWTSAPYASETTVDPASDFHADYAHINSFEVLPDGHLLASFRHLSSVYKIATHADGAHLPGDVLWKLGGRDSDFTFPDGDAGPCAQHTARMLPGGNVLMFDNGSWAVNSQTLCVDPADPGGPSVARTSTRVVEFQLDEVAGSAEPVRSFSPSGWFALFAGSTQPLPAGATMIGWAAETRAMATEISDGGEVLWELRDASSGLRYFSYRAHKALVPDVTLPEVAVTAPTDGASYLEGESVVAAYECTDRGGSSLQTCSGPVEPGQPVHTSTPGTHSFQVTAADGAAGVTTVTRTYSVLPVGRPDAAIRVRGTPDYRGLGHYGGSARQRVKATIDRPGGKARVLVKLTNDGAVADRLSVEVREDSPWFRVSGSCADHETSPTLAPGQSWVCRLNVTRLAAAQAGRKTLVRVPVRSVTNPSRRDVVAVKVRARSVDPD